MPPTQRRNPVLFLPHDQLMAAAEIPHVAADLRPQSCKRVARALPSARVGSGHPAAEFPRVALRKAENQFLFRVCAHPCNFITQTVSYYQTG